MGAQDLNLSDIGDHVMCYILYPTLKNTTSVRFTYYICHFTQSNPVQSKCIYKAHLKTTPGGQSAEDNTIKHKDHKNKKGNP